MLKVCLANATRVEMFPAVKRNCVGTQLTEAPQDGAAVTKNLSRFRLKRYVTRQIDWQGTYFVLYFCVMYF